MSLKSRETQQQQSNISMKTEKNNYQLISGRKQFDFVSTWQHPVKNRLQLENNIPFSRCATQKQEVKWVFN